MADYLDGYWWSADGVHLHYRDYPASPDHGDHPALLCLPGLTRNARDFEPLADRLAGQWRLICPEYRGRGDSGYAKDAMSYVPFTYAQDIERLLLDLNLQRYVAVGTSLGGIVAMLMAAMRPGRLAGAIFNDVGPAIEAAGLARIRSYVGAGNAQPTWMHAARALADAQKDSYPDYAVEDWLAMAKRLYRLNSAGRVVFDYDARIAEPFRAPGGEAGVDLWPTMAAFQGVPTLIVRGALSDILSEATARRMLKDIGPGAELVTVARIGHAPTLAEPQAAVAIDRLVQQAAAGG